MQTLFEATPLLLLFLFVISTSPKYGMVRTVVDAWMVVLGFRCNIYYYFDVRFPIQFGFPNELDLDVIRNSIREMRNSCK